MRLPGSLAEWGGISAPSALRLAVFLLISVSFLMPAVVSGRQQPSQDFGQSQSQTPVRQTCSDSANAVKTAEQHVEHDQLIAVTVSGSKDVPANENPQRPASELRDNPDAFRQSEAEIDKCFRSLTGTTSQQGPVEDCSNSQLLDFQLSRDGEPVGNIPIWRHPDGSAFFFESGMTIDADGAPNAYHPDNIGLDDLANAGGPGYWPGLAKDKNGDPYIQGPDDPFPGYYVSATALADRDKAVNDPARYVDASKIPFIVLPPGVARQAGARTGDFAMVFNLRNGKSSPAIFADIGPSDHIGEGSVALAENLGIRSDARNGGTRGQILWLVFAGSGNGRPRPIEEINAEADRLLQAWGGTGQLTACTIQ